MDVLRRLFAEIGGVDELSDRHIQAGHQQIIEHAGEEITAQLVETFQTIGLDGIRKNPELFRVAQATTYWLYTGIFPDLRGENVTRGSTERPEITSEEDYFESLVWRVIQAHPQALSGGYYGHWHYPPEDTDE